MLYREFTLDNEQRWDAAKSFIEANYKPLAATDTRLRLIVTTQQAKRNQEQNKRYWRAVLQPISEQAWLLGKQYSKDVWHEFYASKHGVKEEMTMPDGELRLRRKSTSEYTVREFSDYMHVIEAEAAHELGIRFPANE